MICLKNNYYFYLLKTMAIGQTYPRYHKRHYRRKKTLTEKVYDLAKQIPDPETKWFDVAIDTGITATGSVFLLAGIPSGTFQNQRIGNRVVCTSHAWKMTLAGDATVTNNSFVRIIFFVWKSLIDNTHPVPTIADILDPTAITILGSGVNAPYLRGASDAFRVLSDKVYVLASGQSYLQVEKWYKKLWANIQFSDIIPPALTDIPTYNGLFVAVMSDQATNAPTIQAVHRLNYQDN